ncbi:DUF1189 family protein [Melissococcus sp. OM08-11BH]|uniref:DUF1189 family protein n=1 Tax=Melissococcus sp. OM08-11BH TaxID=2293110 RepID=UPI000E46CCB2|nr:DUF1189 family protein [Melissococcus sp. OM08-11BH]RGI30214.1 hypothetical protein DXC12_06500 [Melissococcus sp. OM08-11BH]
MIEDKFPMNYFKMSFSPKKMFLGRDSLRWYQKMVIVFFLLSLMLIPISIQSKNVPSIKLDALYPKLVQQLKTEPSNKKLLKEISIVDGKLMGKSSDIKSSNIVINPEKTDQASLTNNVVFFSDRLELVDGEKTIKIAYDEDLTIHGIASMEEFISFVEENWNEQTVFYRTIGYTFLIGMLVLVSSVFLIFGTSLFIYLTRKNDLSSIKTYREATNLVMNALFIPTLVSAIFGMFHYDVSLMLTIQALGLAIIILLIFVKTKFNDKLVTV